MRGVGGELGIDCNYCHEQNQSLCCSESELDESEL